MVNMPGFAQACQLSKEHGFENQVGLHLNLSEGEPLTDRIKSLPMFCDNDGRFNGAFRRSRRFTFFMSSAEKKAVKEEENDPLSGRIDAHLLFLLRNIQFVIMSFARLHAPELVGVHHIEQLADDLIRDEKALRREAPASARSARDGSR